MATSVVDFLEMVEVQHEEAERAANADLARLFAAERLQNCLPVYNARQSIVGSAKAEFVARRNQAVLQVQDTHSHTKACVEFLGVERLREIVVRTRIEAAQQVFLLAFRCQEQDIDVRVGVSLANPLAHLYALQSRHHPIEKGKARRIVFLENFQSVRSVGNGENFEAALQQKGFENAARNRIIFRNQNADCWFFISHHGSFLEVKMRVRKTSPPPNDKYVTAPPSPKSNRAPKLNGLLPSQLCGIDSQHWTNLPSVRVFPVRQQPAKAGEHSNWQRNPSGYGQGASAREHQRRRWPREFPPTFVSTRP